MKITPEKSPDLSGIKIVDSFKIKDISINTIVLEHLKKLGREKSTSINKMTPRTDSFSVSQSSYDCYRKIYFEMKYPREANENSIGRFTMGDIIDKIMKESFEGIGARTDVLCSKRYFDDKFQIKGSPDAEFDDLIVEVKSVSPFAWKYIAGGKTRDEVIVGKPKIQHVRQLNTYMDIEGIKDGVLVYINKDNFEIKTYSIIYNKELMTHTAAGCVTVYRAILENRVPAKIKSDECLYCGHKDLCKDCS